MRKDSHVSTPRPIDSREYEDQLHRRHEAIWKAFLRDRLHRSDDAHELPGWMTLSGNQLSCLIRLTPFPDVVTSVVNLQRRLSRHGVLIPHPARFLHLTIRMFGEASGEYELLAAPRLCVPIQYICDSVSRSLCGLPAFQVILRGVNSWPEAPFVQVFDAGAILEIRRRIDQALPEAPDRDYPGGFLPHLTLGYYHFGADLTAIAREMAGLREYRVGRFSPRSVDLVWGRGASPHPELVTIARYPLA